MPELIWFAAWDQQFFPIFSEIVWEVMPPLVSCVETIKREEGGAKGDGIPSDRSNNYGGPRERLPPIKTMRY